jgi:exonuclease VII large subunit
LKNKIGLLYAHPHFSLFEMNPQQGWQADQQARPPMTMEELKANPAMLAAYYASLQASQRQQMGVAQLQRQQQQRAMMEAQRRQQQQQRPMMQARPVQVSGDLRGQPQQQQLKRPPEQIEQAKIVKQRIDESLLRDHNAVTNPSIDKFKGKQDIVNRLLPFHVFQIVELEHLKYDKLDANTVITEAKDILKRGFQVLEVESRKEKEALENFAASLVK